MTPILDEQKRLVGYATTDLTGPIAQLRLRQSTRAHDRPFDFNLMSPDVSMDPNGTSEHLTIQYWELPFYYKGHRTHAYPIITIDGDIPDWFWSRSDVIDVRHAAPIQITERR